MIPLVPSETMVILGGVAAGQGELWLAAVIGCAVAGAFLGTRRPTCSAGTSVRRSSAGSSAGPRARPDWSGRAHQLEVRGGMLLVTARFIPGGRTVVTFTSGLTRQPFRRFLGFIGFAAVVWACYAALLGFLGGKAFADNHTLAFLVAFGCALVRHRSSSR